MAQYKVPQDVEADDKLLGPFSFRQFVYLLIAGGLIALAVGLFQIFPLLAIIPVPFVLFFGALALPLKKDQPMETYLAALVSYYLKPRTRIWAPGQRNTVIAVTAPKKVEETRTRDITGEEATHRLSFLAGIVDTQGYAIKGLNSSTLKDDLIAEANSVNDMFETRHFDNLVETINKDENARYEGVIQEMKDEIRRVEDGTASTSRSGGVGRAQLNRVDMMNMNKVGTIQNGLNGPDFDSSVVVRPVVVSEDENARKTQPVVNKKVETIGAKPSIIELANNADFSVATIAKQANRIKGRDEGEVFISLH